MKTIATLLLLTSLCSGATISGRVTPESLFVYRSITVVLEGSAGMRTAQTSPFGHYQFTGLEPGIYAVYPQATKWQVTFSPSVQMVEIISCDPGDIDFTYSPIGPFSGDVIAVPSLCFGDVL